MQSFQPCMQSGSLNVAVRAATTIGGTTRIDVVDTSGIDRRKMGDTACIDTRSHLFLMYSFLCFSFLSDIRAQMPVMTLGDVVTENNCILTEQDIIILEGFVNLTGVEADVWSSTVQLRILDDNESSESQVVCQVVLSSCSSLSDTGCYCQESKDSLYLVIFNQTAEVQHSQKLTYLSIATLDSTSVITSDRITYPHISGLNVTLSYGDETQSPPINSSRILVPDDNQVIQFEVTGLSLPSSISYSLSRPNLSREVVNQSSVSIPVFDYTNCISIWFEDKTLCKTRASYYFTLKAVNREDPILNVGPVTSSKECVMTNSSLVTFEAVVDFTGVDYSKWGLFFFFTTPPGRFHPQHFSLCVFSVENCGDNVTLPCYCKSHVRDVYSIVFNTKASHPVHSEHPIIMIGSRLDYTPIRTETGPEYPYVNVDIKLTMNFGNQTQWSPVNNSVIYIPDDNQVILVTITGMRYPSSVGYRLSNPPFEQEFENQTSIDITVYDNTNYITIWYEENDFCRRSASYAFTLKAVYRQDPTLSIGPIDASSQQCVLAGTSLVTFEAVANFTGVDYLDWSSTVYFTTSSSTESICHLSLTQCEPAPSQQCYCKDHIRDVYNIVFNGTADSSLGLQPIKFKATRQNLTTIEADGTLLYPFVSEHINITLSFGKETHSPPIDNSKIFIPDDDPVIQVSLHGLLNPSSLSYSLSNSDGQWDFENQSSVNITMPNSTNHIMIRYEETDFCQRRASYDFPVKVVWREDPVVVADAFQVSNSTICVIHDHGYVAMESTIDFTGVDEMQWMQSVNFIASNNVVCNVSLLECEPSSPHQCYCKYRREEMYTVVFNHTADSSLSTLMTQLVAYRRDNSSVQDSGAIEYPFVSDKIDVTFEYAYQGVKPFINNSIQEILDEHPMITFSVNGLTQPYTINYTTVADPGHVTSVKNTNTITMAVSETRITITYEEMQHCQRRESYVVTLEDYSSDGLSTGAIVGLVFGALLLLVLIIVIVVVAFNKNCWFRRRKSSPYTTTDGVFVDGSNSTSL